MLAAAKGKIAEQGTWIKERRERIAGSLGRLDRDFEALRAQAQ